eukprot:12833697-Alexandrium_andersonii.AAC.1
MSASLVGSEMCIRDRCWPHSAPEPEADGSLLQSPRLGLGWVPGWRSGLVGGHPGSALGH